MRVTRLLESMPKSRAKRGGKSRKITGLGWSLRRWVDVEQGQCHVILSGRDGIGLQVGRGMAPWRVSGVNPANHLDPEDPLQVGDRSMLGQLVQDSRSHLIVADVIDLGSTGREGSREERDKMIDSLRFNEYEECPK